MIAKFYTDYYENLIRFCLSLSGSMAMAEDIVQETFMRALENAQLFDELSEAQGRSWLYKTAKNLFIDKVRKQSRQTTMEDEASEEDDLSEIMVRLLVNQLPKEEATLFWMRYMEGYNSSELSELFHMSSSTIRSKLASARKKLTVLYFENNLKGEQE